MLRIAFSAKAGSGKSEAVKTASEMLGIGNSVIVKFADPLYDLMHLVQDYMGMDRHKDGKFLQLIGTDWGRDKDPQIWTNKFKEKVDQIGFQQIILCDDVRMENELELVKELGFFTIRINRPEELRSQYLVGRNTSHKSEIELDDKESLFDFVIENNSDSVKIFKNQVRLAIMTALSKRQVGIYADTL